MQGDGEGGKRRNQKKEGTGTKGERREGKREGGRKGKGKGTVREIGEKVKNGNEN